MRHYFKLKPLKFVCFKEQFDDIKHFINNYEEKILDFENKNIWLKRHVPMTGNFI